MEDEEFCRVCRSEGTQESPLYYPCKCSGSIKFVHQDCLMEWLRHSQKGHCELCKTRFQFTKPEMPSQLPIPLLIRRVLVKLRQNIAFGLRCMLVLLLWLVYLPWFTQQAWRYSLALSEAPDILTATAESVGFKIKTEDTSNASGFISARNYTSNPSIKYSNGQIITCAMVLTFVVIFLVREWVVQNALGILDENMPVGNEALLPAEAGHGGDGSEDADDGEGDDDQDWATEHGDWEDDDGAEETNHQSLPDSHSNGLGAENNSLNDQGSAGSDHHRVNHQAAGDLHHPYNGDQAMERRVQRLHQGAAQVAIVRQQLEDRRRQLDMERQRDVNALAEGDEAGDELEGFFELVGLRGPMIALYQNILLINILTWGILFFFITTPALFGKLIMLCTIKTSAVGILRPVGDSESYVVGSFRRFFSAPFVGLGRILTGFLNAVSDVPVVVQGGSTIGSKVLDHLVPISFGLLRRAPAPAPPSRPNSLTSHVINKSLAMVNRLASKNMHWVKQDCVSGTGYEISTRELRTLLYNVRGPLGFGVSLWDRLFSLMIGYTSSALLLTLYFYNSPLLGQETKFPKLREFELTLREALRQIGSMVKFLFIISIEIVIFPVYCGILSHLSLMNLFKNLSIAKALEFAHWDPATCVFLHWFIGTIYMFQFAKFVSMCREIVRPGVLFFIRDPNDPQFHPIKEILERPVTTQLRKIGVSALFYLVLISGCIGVSVSAVSYLIPQLFPLQIYTNEPLLEVPIDLVCFHMIVPVLKHILKPSKMASTLWAKVLSKLSARLRLSSFIFGGRYKEEEGSHYHGTWTAFLLCRPGDIDNPVEKGTSKAEGESLFVRDGSFVKAPAIDTLPTRERMLHPVTESGEPLDDYGRRHLNKDDPNYTTVYIPPAFRLRIVLYLFCLWVVASELLFAVIAGPLTIGKVIFKVLMPTVRMHDLYALTFGYLALAGVTYAINMAGAFYRFLTDSPADEGRHGSRTMFVCKLIASSVARWTVLTSIFGVLIPMMMGVMWESYILFPISLYMRGKSTMVAAVPHDWVVGLFMTKLVLQILLIDEQSDLSRAIRRVFAQSWLEPEIFPIMDELAFPLLIILLGLLVVPSLMALLFHMVVFHGMKRRQAEIGYLHLLAMGGKVDEHTLTKGLYLVAYPIFALMITIGVVANLFMQVLARWTSQIKDEVYLVGQQLHNHGELAPERAFVSGS